MSEGSNTDMAENPFPAIRPDWLAQVVEPVIDPDYPIVDAHHHLFDVPLWRYRFDDYLADIGSGHNVIATVYAECGSMYKASGPAERRPIGETEFANGVAAMSASGGFGKTRVCSAIFGHVDLTIGARAREVLQGHIQAGGGRFRGIRHATVYDPSPAIRTTLDQPPQYLMADKKFREGFACLAPLGLSFDVWMYHTQLPDLISLVRAFPDTTFVLDHVAGVLGIGPYAGRRDEIFATWARDMRELAAHPNVNVKVGGLAMHTVGFGFHEKKLPPTSEELASAWRPYVETTIGAFGADRCMFESNFPVDKVSCSYGVMWNAFKRLAEGVSADDKAALMHKTATRVYKLQLDPGTE